MRYLSSEEEVEEEEEESAAPLPTSHHILWVLTNISSSLSMVISVVYWSVLYNPARNTLDFENFSGHLLIAAIHLVDVCLCDRSGDIRGLLL